jgi:hypothetical protein
MKVSRKNGVFWHSASELNEIHKQDVVSGRLHLSTLEKLL